MSDSTPEVDVVLRAAVREIEAHAAEAGWDQPARLYALIGGPEVAQAPQAEDFLNEFAKIAHGFKGGNLAGAASALAAARNLGQGLDLDPLFDHIGNMLAAAEHKKAAAAQ